MLFTSEILNKSFKTQKECEEAEKAYAEKLAAEKAKKEEKQAQRASRAKEVEEALERAVEAENEYQRLLKDFLHDYKTFHYTTSEGKNTLSNIFPFHFLF